MNPLELLKIFVKKGLRSYGRIIPGMTTMKKDAVFIFSEEQFGYSFSDTHPFNQKRITLTLDLLKEIECAYHDATSSLPE